MVDRAAEVSYFDDIWVGYRHFATKNVKTAYPFGFGLSSTTFGYTGLALSGGVRCGLTRRVTVTNTGKTAGREVVSSTCPRPGSHCRSPRSSSRIREDPALTPGESQTLTFTLRPRPRLVRRDVVVVGVEPGTYTVKVGASSEDIRQTATFTKATAETVAKVSVSVKSPDEGPTKVGRYEECSPTRRGRPVRWPAPRC